MDVSILPDPSSVALLALWWNCSHSHLNTTEVPTLFHSSYRFRSELCQHTGILKMDEEFPAMEPFFPC